MIWDICDCDDPDCNRCYPPALEFEPAELPPSGGAEPDDYFEEVG